MNRTLRFSLPARFPGFGLRPAGILVTLVGLAVALWLYLGLPLVYLPLAPVGLAALLLTMNYPLAGLNFVIAAQYMPIEVGGFTVLQLGGAVVAVLTLIWLSATKRRFIIPGIIFPIIVFALLTLYSLSYTRHTGVTVYSVRKFALNALFCVVLVNLAGTFRRFRQPLMVLVMMGLVNSGVAVVQSVTGWQKVEERSRGLLENENALGEVAAIAFIVPFYMFLYSQERRKRMLCLGLCGLLFLGMVTSISRGAFLSFLVGLLFILLREKRYRLRLFFIGLLLASAYPLLPKAFHYRFENLGAEIQGTVELSRRIGLSNRGYYNKGGIRIWKSHPWLGVGLGNYGFYFQMPEFNPGKKSSRWLPAHNLYIQALAETGMVGFIVLCWWILQAAFNYWVAEKKGVGDEDLIVLRSCEVITLITLIAAFASGNMLNTNLAMVLAFSEVCRRSAGGAEIRRGARVSSSPVAPVRAGVS